MDPQHYLRSIPAPYEQLCSPSSFLPSCLPWPPGSDHMFIRSLTHPSVHSFTTLNCPCPCPPPPPPLPLPPPFFLNIPFVPKPPCCLLCSLRCPLSISCLPEFKTLSLCACCWGEAWKRRSTDELRVPRRVSPTPWLRISRGRGEKKRGVLTWMPTAAVLRFCNVPGACCCCWDEAWGGI